MNSLHVDLLLLLRAAGSNGVPIDSLVTSVRRGAHRDATVPGVELSLRNLADLSLASTFVSGLGVKRWSITGKGERALTEEGL